YGKRIHSKSREVHVKSALVKLKNHRGDGSEPSSDSPVRDEPVASQPQRGRPRTQLRRSDRQVPDRPRDWLSGAAAGNDIPDQRQVPAAACLLQGSRLPPTHDPRYAAQATYAQERERSTETSRLACSLLLLSPPRAASKLGVGYQPSLSQPRLLQRGT